METARQTPPGARPNRSDVGAQASGPSGPVVRVGCLMRRAPGVREEWPSRLRCEPQAIQNPAYRSADTSNGGSAENTAGSPPIFGFQCGTRNFVFGGTRYDIALRSGGSWGELRTMTQTNP